MVISVWTPDRDDDLRALARTPLHADEIARRLGVTAGAAATRMSRLGLREILTESQVLRIVELHTEHYRISRIVRQLGVDESSVVVTLVRDGRIPAPKLDIALKCKPLDRAKPSLQTRLLTPARTAYVRSELLKGRMQVDLAAELGCSFSSIHRVAAAAGLAKKRETKHNALMTRRDELQVLVDGGLSHPKIAKRLGSSPATVRRAITRLQIRPAATKRLAA